MRYKPKPLIIFSVIGLVTTTVLAVRATPKALRNLEKLNEESFVNPTTTEKAKAVFPPFIPTIVSGIATIGCIFGSDYISFNHNAKLTTVLLLSDSMFRKYQKHTKYILDEERFEKVEENIAQEDYEKQKNELKEEYPIGDKLLFYETFSDRFFYSTYAEVIYAMYHWNRNFLLGAPEGGCMAEFFDFLGLDEKENRKYAYWGYNAETMTIWGLIPWIDITLREKKLRDGTPYVEIGYIWEILADYKMDAYEREFGD